MNPERCHFSITRWQLIHFSIQNFHYCATLWMLLLLLFWFLGVGCSGYLPHPWRWWWCHPWRRRCSHHRAILRRTCRQRRPPSAPLGCRRSDRRRALPERWPAAPTEALPSLRISPAVSRQPPPSAVRVTGPTTSPNNKTISNISLLHIPNLGIQMNQLIVINWNQFNSFLSIH